MRFQRARGNNRTSGWQGRKGRGGAIFAAGFAGMRAGAGGWTVRENVPASASESETNRPRVQEAFARQLIVDRHHCVARYLEVRGKIAAGRHRFARRDCAGLNDALEFRAELALQRRAPGAV